MSIIIIIVLAIVGYFVYKHYKSNFNDNLPDIYREQQYTPEGCDFIDKNRPFPSGHLPGMYIAKTQQEEAMILKRFVDEKEPNLI